MSGPGGNRLGALSSGWVYSCVLQVEGQQSSQSWAVSYFPLQNRRGGS